MKKNVLFLVPMIIVAVLLFMLRVTHHMPMHIAVSVVGLLILVAYTVATKKEWKSPALEMHKAIKK